MTSLIPENKAIEGTEKKFPLVILVDTSGSMISEQDKLIDELSHLGKKTVVVMHNGAPVAMPWIDNVDAVIDMQLAGDATHQNGRT